MSLASIIATYVLGRVVGDSENKEALDSAADLAEPDVCETHWAQHVNGVCPRCTNPQKAWLTL